MIQKRLWLFILLLLLTGCNRSSSDVLSEINQKDLNKEVVTFIEKIKESNGIYLYSVADEDQYLIINSMYVNQGDSATFIDSIQSEIQNRILEIKVKELTTEKLDDKRVGQLRVYQLNRSSDFDMIQIYKNDKETKFDLVGT